MSGLEVPPSHPTFMTVSDDIRPVTANRRELLALSGVVLAVPGCFGEDRRSDDSGGPGDPANGSDGEGTDGDGGRSDPGVDAAFELGFRQRGIDTEVWTAVADVVSESRTQGIAYRDGHLYVAGTEEGSHSTVYEFRRDGEYTGASHTFGDGGHVNCLQWHDGDLWAMGFTAGEVYRVDFDDRRVVGSFSYGNGTVLSESPNNFVFVPTESGGSRMVAVAAFGSTAAHVIDHEAAIRDGTAAGNVDATIDAGPFENTDGVHYRDGHAYYTNYAGENSRGAAFKVSLPTADRMDDGYRVVPDDLEWYHAFETWSDGGHVQDLTYDRDEDVWYLVSDDDAKRIYRGPERVHATVPKAWRAWNAVGSERYGRALSIDSDGTRSLPVFATPRSDVRVVIPFYDGASADASDGASADASDGASTAAQIAAGVDDGNGGSVLLGVDASAPEGDARYRAWGSSRSDTGVPRVDGGWALFEFTATDERIELRISDDGGETWTQAGAAGSAAGIAGVTLSALEVDGSRIAVGPVAIDVSP